MARKRASALISAVLASVSVPAVTSGQISASWLQAVSGEFDSTTAWSVAPAFPNNGGGGGGLNYSATVAATGALYTVRLARDITVSGLHLDSQGASLLQSAGVLRAGLVRVSDGEYKLEGGTLAESRVEVAGGTFVGSRTNGGQGPRMENVTLAGTMVMDGISRVTVGGMLTLDGGTISLRRDDFNTSAARLVMDNGASIGGSGTISFDGVTKAASISGGDFNHAIVIGSGVTVTTGTGSGEIGGSGAPLDNAGLIVSKGGQQIRIANLRSNTGRLRAESGGELFIAGELTPAALGSLDTATGVANITATIGLGNNTFDVTTLGPNVRFTSGARIRDGRLSSAQPVVLFADGLRLDRITVGSDLTFTGPGSTIEIGGGLVLDQATVKAKSNTAFAFDAGTGLTGNGILQIEGIPESSGFSAHLYSPSGGTFTIGQGVTVQTGAQVANGNGNILLGSATSTLVNRGLIHARTAGSSVVLAPGWSNLGTLRTSAGTMVMDGNFSFASIGSFERAGGDWLIRGLPNNDGGTVDLTGSPGSLRIELPSFTGGSLRGRFIASDAAPLVISSSNVPNVLNLEDFAAEGKLTLSGQSVRVKPSADLSGVRDLTLQNGVTIEGSRQFSSGTRVLIAGLNVSGATTTVTFSPGAALTVSGSLRPENGALVRLEGLTTFRGISQVFANVQRFGPIEMVGLGSASVVDGINISSLALSGPGVSVRGGGALLLRPEGDSEEDYFTTNRTQILVSGVGSRLFVGFSNQSLGDLQTNAATGEIDVQLGARIRPLRSVQNLGLIRIDRASQLAIGNITVPEGTFPLGRLVNGESGRLTAVGNVLAGLTNFGVVEIGDSAPGSLSFSGSIVLGDSSELLIDLGGPSAGQFDVLRGVGSVALDGDLNVSLLSSFVPQVGQQFQILRFGSLSGTFDNINLPVFQDSRRWSTTQLYTQGLLTVVPEPACLGLLPVACLLVRRTRVARHSG